MKPITIAKNIWKHAVEVQNKIDSGVMSRESVLYHYFGILTMYACEQAAHYSNDQEWLNEIVDMLDKYPYEFENPKYHFHYNFCNYRVGGLGKSWGCMKGFFEKNQIEQVRFFAEKEMEHNKSSEGILCGKWIPERELIWVDVIFAVVPYMLFAGIALKEDKYIDFAIDQTIKMYDVFLDDSCGLLHQSRGFMGDNTSISHDHWGRGNGWAYIGLTELIRYLPKEHKRYNEVLERYISLSNTLIKYQDHRGLWRQIVSEPLAWEESSGTSLFLYGFGVGMRMGILDKDVFMPAFEKGLIGLMKYCVGPDFSIDKCCTGCLCPGETPERKGTVEAYLVETKIIKDDGHAFGPLILAFLEAHRNGIDNLIWR